MAASQAKKIGMASLIMMASVFLSRVIGLVREMVISHVVGANASVDAYQIAFVLPEILNHVLASGFLSITFIPIFNEYLGKEDEREGWRIFSIIMTVFGGILAVLIGIAMVFATQLVHAIAPSLEDPQVIHMAVKMTRIVMPAQLFFFAGGLFMAVQYARERFFLPALAPLIYNVGIISGGLLLGHRLGMEGFAWGVLGGAFIGNFLVQWIGAAKASMRYSPSFFYRHEKFKTYIKVTIPFMVGLSLTFSTEFLLKFFGSSLPEGSIARLNYAFRIMLILVGFFGQAVGVAAYPFLSRLVSQGKKAEMAELLDNTLRFMAIVIPFSVLFIVLRQEIIRLLLQHGAFTAQDTARTADLLMFFSIGAIAFAGQTIVSRGFYALQNTLYPTVVTSITVICCIPMFYLCTAYMGSNGLALAASLSAILQVVVLYVMWRRKINLKASSTVGCFYLKILLMSGIIGGVLEWGKQIIPSPSVMGTFATDILTCLGVGIVFLFFLFALAFIFKLTEIQEMLRRIMAKAGIVSR